MSELLIDDILIELEDDFLDDETESLPLTKLPVEGFATKPYDLRSTLDDPRVVGKLFDFSESDLTPVQQMYIIGYATRGTKKGGCELADVTYSVVNKWLENEEFKKALDNAVDVVRDTLEEELLRRAMDGSDRLLLEAVKAARPDRYNKKQTDVSVNANVIHSWADLAKQAAVTAIEAKDEEYEVDADE